MNVILCIDTSLESAAVGIGVNGVLNAIKTNARQMDHAAWIHNAIHDLLLESNINKKDISAVAVTSGPGSYTGLRVGMASAKGLCYALGLPLITENTLKLTAWRTRLEAESAHSSAVVYCPMIDARRMEVFTAAYDHNLEVTLPPSALILHQNSFSEELDKGIMIFSGNGSAKWKEMCDHPNARFARATHSLHDLATVASEKYEGQKFTDLAYSEPDYFKHFYSGK
jgi:tRNA threonylcarbamoyladenosine biosynthesis protein TsaB